MNMHHRRVVRHSLARRPWWCFAVLLIATTARGQDSDPEAAAAFYARDVQPLIERRCASCHGGRERYRGGFRLTSRDLLLHGGDSGAAIDLEKPDASLLLAMISYRDEQHRMPPSGKLADDEIETLTRWVRMGAPFTAEADPIAGSREEEPVRKLRGDGMEGWSYRPLRRPVPPASDATWIANPIDAFLLARLSAAGLSPAPPADRITLLRRASYDLTGLPPTPEEIDAFVADDAPDAFARTVERLLASPHYGEHWGRHWLDLVRYAETNGFERDSNKPWIWRYRDYVIDAFNGDKPYDRFVLEQLAGDELDDATAESRIATGYHRLMIWDDEPGAGAIQGRYDVLNDLVATTSQVFLGMTLGCARCHDHKGDPLPQEDFYRFMAFFHGVTDMSTDGYVEDVAPPARQAAYAAAKARRKADEADLVGRRADIEDAFRRRLLALDHDAVDLVGSDLVDLRYRFYRDTWESLPDFDALRPEDAGELAHGLFDLGPATRRRAIGLVFEGQLVVAETDEYEFFVRAKEHGRLAIDGADGIAPATERRQGVARAVVRLEKGLHPVRLEYFAREEPDELEVWWTRGPRRWRYTEEKPPTGWERPDFDDASWPTGLAGFGDPSTPGTAVATLWSSREIWLRSSFEWTEDEARDLVVVGHHDDNFELFINGVSAVQGHGYVTRYREFPISDAARSAIRAGANLVAIRCDQDFGGQYVHLVPVARSRLRGGDLMDVAFARRPLSFGAAAGRLGDVGTMIAERGREILGDETIARYDELGRRLAQVKARALPERTLAALVQEEGGRVPDLHVHVRGNAAVEGPVVEPAFPSCVAGTPTRLPPAGGPTSGRRRVLAEWIASRDNPLTARVMANRLWQFHFGRGLVPTANDFGEFGERPSHPELLDWLASELIARDWSLKAMHRLIMASSAYRMSSRPEPTALERDPANRLLWRFERRRLAAEEVRDSVIAATGLLNPKMGGPSFYSLLPAAVLATSSRPDEVWGRSSADERNRRSVYIKVKRSLVTPLLTDFDLADTDASCAVRFNTTQPMQALNLLNGEFTNQRAAAFVARLHREGGTRAEQVTRALRLAVGRRPTEQEVARYVAFVAELEADFGLEPDEALRQFCLMVLNLNEFVYLD